MFSLQQFSLFKIFSAKLNFACHIRLYFPTMVISAPHTLFLCDCYSGGQNNMTCFLSPNKKKYYNNHIYISYWFSDQTQVYSQHIWSHIQFLMVLVFKFFLNESSFIICFCSYISYDLNMEMLKSHSHLHKLHIVPDLSPILVIPSRNSKHKSFLLFFFVENNFISHISKMKFLRG